MTLTTTGLQTWSASGPNAVSLGLYFGDNSDTLPKGKAAMQRFDLPRDVAPDESVTLAVTIAAP